MTHTNIPHTSSPKVAPSRALFDGANHLLTLRQDDYWEGEVVWNPMLAAQYIIALHTMEKAISPERRAGLVQQLRAMQLDDGSGLWGMHRYGGPSLFVSTLCYVAARLCGVPARDPLLAGARDFFATEDVLAIPSWGKLWLSIAGLYDYEGVNAVPPEAWLMPESVPLHPANYYCHTRLIYMGMACVRSLRVTAPETPLTRSLRSELYPGRRYEELDFKGSRDALRRGDLWAAPSTQLRLLYKAVNAFERVHHKGVRARLIKRFTRSIRFELRSSDYTCLSPVNGLLFALTLHAQNPKDPDLEKQLARFSAGEGEDSPVQGWVWNDDEEGLRVTGARSATWDTSFAIQALIDSYEATTSAKEKETLAEGIRSALTWLETQQMAGPTFDSVARYQKEGRVDPTGGFCFAGVWHGWPVSDCTAEALCAMLEAPEELYEADEERVQAGLEFLLQAQNPDGGFGSYEARKHRASLEWMNPAEMFGDSMTELSYYECTASNLMAMSLVRKRFPQMQRARVDEAMKRAETLLRSAQNDDGSWDGAWGVGYLYGTMFGVRGLRAAGATSDDPAIKRACAYVQSVQRADGAFSESWRSLIEDRFVHADEAHPTQTAWALLTLVEGDALQAAADAADALERLQLESGDWPSPMMSGVFFRTALLDYRLYRRFFPVWALAKWSRTRNAPSQKSRSAPKR